MTELPPPRCFPAFTASASAATPNFEFTGLVHRAGALFDEKQFDGDENAIVDFKYSSSPKITWWFDHHESAFLSPADAEHFEQDQSNRKFYDPDFKSCTSFIAMIAQQRFGFDPAPVADLVHWTDIIDGALYADAKTAVEMKAPAMKLTMVIESAPDHGFVPNLIPLLATKSLGEILEEPFVAPLLPPLLKRHELSIGILQAAHRVQGRHHLLRRHRSRSRGLQQVHSLLPASGVGLQRGSEQEQLSRESFGGIESLGAAGAGSEPGPHLRALRRRRPRPRRRDLFNVNQHAAAIKARKKLSPNCAPPSVKIKRLRCSAALPSRR